MAKKTDKEKTLDGWTRLIARSIGTFFPTRAIRFIQARQALAGYTAAKTKGPNQLWKPSNKSADNILKTEHSLIRARARELTRNNSYIAGGARRICNNVIYRGIKPQAQIKMPDGKPSDKNNIAEAARKKWAEAVNWHEKENLILRHLWHDGEIFVHWFYNPELEKKDVIPLDVELLECDHLDTSKTGVDDNRGGIWKNGILYSKYNSILGYMLFKEHPGNGGWYNSNDSVFVSAVEVDHVFIRERASQSRGVPWIASIIMEMRDFTEWQNNERLAQRLMSAFGVFVKSDNPEIVNNGNPFHNPDAGEGSETEAGLPEYIEPARIQPLPKGTDISSIQFDRPGKTYEPFVKTSLKGSSAGANMSYESFSNDYTDASYSSARSATLEERRGYQVLQFILSLKVESPAWVRLWKMNKLSRTIADMPLEIPVVWQFPGWPWVDPDKDSKAAERDIKNGLNSRHKANADKGNDYIEIKNDLDAEEADGFPGKNIENDGGQEQDED